MGSRFELCSKVLGLLLVIIGAIVGLVAGVTVLAMITQLMELGATFGIHTPYIGKPTFTFLGGLAVVDLLVVSFGFYLMRSNNWFVRFAYPDRDDGLASVETERPLRPEPEWRRRRRGLGLVGAAAIGVIGVLLGVGGARALTPTPTAAASTSPWAWTSGTPQGDAADAAKGGATAATNDAPGPALIAYRSGAAALAEAIPAFKDAQRSEMSGDPRAPERYAAALETFEQALEELETARRLGSIDPEIDELIEATRAWRDTCAESARD